MLNFFKFYILIFFIFLISCSSNQEKITVLDDEDIESQMIDAYKKGYEELEKGDVIYAAKQFNEAELLYPQSEWAPKAVLLAAYAFYSQDYYPRAIAEIERFIKKYPKHKNIDYAYFLLAMCYYEKYSVIMKIFQFLNLKKRFYLIHS